MEKRPGDKPGALADYAFVLAVWRNADPELAAYVTTAREGARRLSGR